MGKPILVAKFRGLEVWALWDDEAELYELFASEQCDDYIGCAEDMAECKIVAQGWFTEMEE